MTTATTSIVRPDPGDIDGLVSQRVKVLMRLSVIDNQAKIGERLGLPQNQVSRRLNGRIPWRLQEVQALARMFDVELGWLLGIEGSRGPFDRGRATTQYLAGKSLTSKYANVLTLVTDVRGPRPSFPAPRAA